MIRKLLKKVGILSDKKSKKSQTKKEGVTASPSMPRIIPRSEHSISRKDISENALKVLYRLHRAGYAAFIVGGGVRDLLLGLHPKDFDVATDASPDEIRSIFRNCRIIGRRFRLAHVHFGPEVVEVATFRGSHEFSEVDSVHPEHGMVMHDNVFGTIEEDAFRRDFTVNALYYNIADFSVVDYVGGMEDIKKGILRVIGEPNKRFREDPVRVLRALRLAVKLNFKLADNLIEPIQKLKGLLQNVPPARLFEEILKLFHGGVANRTYVVLKEQGLFQYLFPLTTHSLQNGLNPTDKLLQQVLTDTDERVKQNKPVTAAFLFAALLWHPLLERFDVNLKKGSRPFMAQSQAFDDVLREQNKHIAIPRRVQIYMREMWNLQLRFERIFPRSVYKLLSEPRFKAAYDFLLVRHKVGEEVAELVQFWQGFLEGDESAREKLIKTFAKKNPSNKARRSRSKHKKKAVVDKGENE